MSRRPALAALALSTFLLLPGSALAQDRADARDWLARCDEWGDRRTERHCELREETITLPGRSLRVSARPNGGVTVTGWDRREVLVRAKIQAWARTEEGARSLASGVTVAMSGGVVESSGPRTRDREGWSVSFEIFAPRDLDLDLESTNGGLRVIDVSGTIGLETTNGGITLDGVGGDVRARTTNGGVKVTLEGSRWDGTGLDIRTTNGGVRLAVPANYSAELETGTTNGGLEIDFPIRVQGRIGRRINTTLGQGGATIRAITTNGGVTVTRN